MRRLVTLMDREWRGLRRMFWVYAALSVVAILVSRWVAGALAAKDANPAFERWTPAIMVTCAVLYAVLAAADSVGDETVSRRLDQLVLLPVRPVVVWMSKAITVLGAALVMGGWCALAQFAALWVIDGAGHAATLIDRWPVVLLAVGAALGVAACTLLVSTLRLRGISAAVAGGGLAFGLGAGICAWLDLIGLHDDYAVFAAPVAGAVVLLAATLAFVHGRVHISIGRPVVIAAATVLGLLVAPGAVWAHVVLRVDPESEGVRIERAAFPSPDGRWVALSVVDEGSTAKPDWAFLLDVEAGTLRRLPHRWLDIAPTTGGYSAWTPGGEIRNFDFARRITRVTVEPATLEVTSAIVQTHAEFAASDAALAPAWRAAHRWSVCKTTSRGPMEDPSLPPLTAVIASLFDPVGAGPEVAEIRSHVRPVVAWSAPVAVFAPEAHVLAMKRLPDGPTTELVRATTPWTNREIAGFSADGEILVLCIDGRWIAFETETGRRHVVGDGHVRPSIAAVNGDVRRHILLTPRADGSATELVDLDSGARAVLGTASLGTLHAGPDGQILAVADTRIDLLARDLRFVRTVWQAGKKRAAPAGSAR